MISGRQLRNHHREGNYWLDTGGAIGIISEYLFVGLILICISSKKNDVEKMNRKNLILHFWMKVWNWILQPALNFKVWKKKIEKELDFFENFTHIMCFA